MKIDLENAKTVHARLLAQQKLGGAATIDDLLDVLELIMPQEHKEYVDELGHREPL